MRVVIDTNVFISSFLGKGSPRKIIDLWKEGKITICLTRQIFDEYLEVLDKLGLKTEREVEEILQIFARGYHSLFTSKPPKINIVDDDPDDDKFFECAVSLKAHFIVSGDKHLLWVKDYLGIKVVNPRQFVEKIEMET